MSHDSTRRRRLGDHLVLLPDGSRLGDEHGRPVKVAPRPRLGTRKNEIARAGGAQREAGDAAGARRGRREAAVEAWRLWSVTTLLKAGLGVGEALVGCRSVTAQRAYDDLEVLAAYSLKGKRADAQVAHRGPLAERGKAMARGSEVHKIMEAYAYGREPEYDRRTGAVRAADIRPGRPPTHRGDGRGAAHNLQYGYAGTLDPEHRGVRCAVDAKTTDKDPNERERSPPPYPERRCSLWPTLEPRRAPRRP